MTENGKTNAGKTPPIVSLLAGGIAGSVECTATYPFEFAKTRVQLRHEASQPASRNPLLMLNSVVRSEGPLAVYRGLPPMVVGSFGKDAARFLTFDLIKQSFADPETGTLSPVRSLLAGMTSGVVASATAVTPTERIKTALIDDARHAHRFRSAAHAVQLIYRETGFLGLYRGFPGTTLKQASATAFRMGTYNILKDFEGRRQIPQDGPIVQFANGSVAGVTTTLATQPFDTIKTRSQSKEGVRTLEALKDIWKDGGVPAFWRGTTMRLGRTIFAGGILFTVYEQVAKLLNPLFSVDRAD